MATAFLDAPGPLAFAHRGGAAHAPENSWRAFEHAVGLGYRYLETDLQATSDGVLVAFHDKTLTRVCGQDGRVRRLSYAELSAARIDGTERIPVLEDLLAAWPDVRFNLDVKDAPAIAPLPEVLRRTNAWDRVCLASFSASRLRATRRALGRPVCMAASPFGTAMARLGRARGPGRPAPARARGARPPRPPPRRRAPHPAAPAPAGPAASGVVADRLAAAPRGRLCPGACLDGHPVVPPPRPGAGHAGPRVDRQRPPGHGTAARPGRRRHYDRRDRRSPRRPR